MAKDCTVVKCRNCDEGKSLLLTVGRDLASATYYEREARSRAPGDKMRDLLIRVLSNRGSHLQRLPEATRLVPREVQELRAK